MAAPTVVSAAAPTRICDNGGWTDTWFAERGAVLNIAVSPCAEVRLSVTPGRSEVFLHPGPLGPSYRLARRGPPWGPHPLLEAALAHMEVEPPGRLDVSVRSEAPHGGGIGGSSAVTVALVGALAALAGERLTPAEAARHAHRVETEGLGAQCGIQDQIAAAYGGVSFIDMRAYPEARVTSLDLAPELRGELERRLVLLYLGRGHDSSGLHEQVIRGLEDAGPGHPVLERLRVQAVAARDALLAGDLAAFGRALRENTEAQESLHPALVGTGARAAIQVARGHGATGWKVNGSGGDGGTLTVLCAAGPGARDALVRDLLGLDPAFREVPIRLDSEGLRVRTGE
jgi:D-glycero-alpha-D-manno-heptose-7-phosphate kinase